MITGFPVAVSILSIASTARMSVQESTIASTAGPIGAHGQIENLRRPQLTLLVVAEGSADVGLHDDLDTLVGEEDDRRGC